jgi:hypothetical protein
MSRILQASRVPEHAVMANRTLRNQGFIEPVQVERALNHRVCQVHSLDYMTIGGQEANWQGVTEASTRALQELLSQVKAGWTNTGAVPWYVSQLSSRPSRAVD